MRILAVSALLVVGAVATSFIDCYVLGLRHDTTSLMSLALHKGMYVFWGAMLWAAMGKRGK